MPRTPRPDPPEETQKDPAVLAGIVAAAGCIGACVPVLGSVACPYAAGLAPFTGPCTALAVASSASDDGEHISAAVGASAGLVVSGGIGGVAGIAYGVAVSQNADAVLIGTLGFIAGAAVGVTILGPFLAGGGAGLAIKLERDATIAAAQAATSAPTAKREKKDTSSSSSSSAAATAAE